LPKDSRGIDEGNLAAQRAAKKLDSH